MEISKNTVLISVSRGVSIAPLVVFRVFFGALTLFSTIRFMVNGWVHEMYIKPTFFFPYLGFEWIKPLGGDLMYIPFILCIIGSIGIILGLFYRFNAALFFTAFTYIELLDKTNYLNHYYAVSLISFLMYFLPAHRYFSLDVRFKFTRQIELIPRYFVLILQFQIALIYFYAGCAKINEDWLFKAEPLKTWLQAFRDLPFIGNWMASPWLAYLFSWFGCFYDLTIPFFLFFAKTRKIAYFFVVIFHILTWVLFPIGVFPWVMIVLTSIYFSESFHAKIIGFKPTQSVDQFQNAKSFLPLFLCFFACIQLAIPWRYLAYPKGVFWHEEGFRFSWRVMLMQKEGVATFYIVDRNSNKSIEINNLNYLTPIQIDQMSTQPDMIVQFAHYLGQQFKDTTLIFGQEHVHLSNPKVEAEVYVSLNGRPHQLMVSRKYDLTKENYNLKHRRWIEPFRD